MASPLEMKFHQAMLATYEQAAQHGYRATRFLRMVRERGGCEAAHQLLRSEGYLAGLTELKAIDRLDISVEALVLQPAWSELFSDQEKDIAKTRLRGLGYAPS